MHNALGIIALLGYIAAVIALAAGLTWLVVRFSPKPKKDQPPAAEEPAV